MRVTKQMLEEQIEKLKHLNDLFMKDNEKLVNENYELKQEVKALQQQVSELKQKINTSVVTNRYPRTYENVGRPAIKLNKNDIQNIHYRHDRGERLEDIAESYGISRSTLYRILKKQQENL